MKFYPNDQGTKATKRTKLDNIKCYSSNCHKQVYLSKARSAELHGCMHPLSFNRRGTYLTGCVSKQKWTSKGFDFLKTSRLRRMEFNKLNKQSAGNPCLYAEFPESSKTTNSGQEVCIPYSPFNQSHSKYSMISLFV